MHQLGWGHPTVFHTPSHKFHHVQRGGGGGVRRGPLRYPPPCGGGGGGGRVRLLCFVVAPTRLSLAPSSASFFFNVVVMVVVVVVERMRWGSIVHWMLPRGLGGAAPCGTDVRRRSGREKGGHRRRGRRPSLTRGGWGTTTFPFVFYLRWLAGPSCGPLLRLRLLCRTRMNAVVLVVVVVVWSA